MNILAELRALREADVAAASGRVPLETLLARAAASPPPPRFSSALRRPAGAPVRVIAELKMASPSKGLIRPDFDPASLASSLEGGGAAALSVLIEPHRFLGSIRNLEIARACTTLPLLYKDFVATEYQIAEARCAGASAVLLIVAMLAEAELRRLFAFARELGLEALVETHSREEIARAAALGARLIGVNSRDLRTFATDPAAFHPLLRAVPDGCVRVAESGVRDEEGLRLAAEFGADAVLVGEALMRAPDPGARLRAMLRWNANG